MRLISLVLLPIISAQSGEFLVVHDKAKTEALIEDCANQNAALAVITDANKDEVSKLLKGGKYMIAGRDDKTNKCLFLDKRARITKKKCLARNKYICEYITPTTTVTTTTTTTTTAAPCEVDPNAESADTDHYKVISTDSAAVSFTWHEAREACQDLGDNWDLVIFNNEGEYNHIRQIITGNCLNYQSYWVGYKEQNQETQTVYKKSAPWRLPWAENEPNDSQGKEDCVRMDKNGKMNDAVCKKTWSGTQADDIGMGYICEKQSYLDRCQPKPDHELPEDNRYFIGEAGQFDWTAARNLCKSRGVGWDLAVIDDQKEHSKLVRMTNCANNAFWIGVTEQNGLATDINGKLVLYTPWDTHSNVKNPEPNDMTGVEECVRMRGDQFNDAKCSLDRTGSPRSGVGMGYICEHDVSQVSRSLVDPSEGCTGDDCGLPCGSNLNVAPWNARPGCPTPESCETGARLRIVDAWKKMQHGNLQYGFVGEIMLPLEYMNKDWSVLIRFSRLNTRGNFQLWNGRFFNFYSGGYEILIHKKWWDSDRQDSSSFAFVADGLNSSEYPELLTFSGRQMKHSCFDSNMHSNAVRSGSANAFQTAVLQQTVGDQRTQRTHSLDYAKILNEALDNMTKVRFAKRKKSGSVYKVKTSKPRSSLF